MLRDKEEIVFNKLKGAKRHYCPDWDYMAIDETTPEFEACTCNLKVKIPTHCAQCGNEYGFADEICEVCGYQG